MGAVYTVTIDDDESSYRCADHRSLLEGMEALGRKGIPVGCRNGGCGVCKVRITSGTCARRIMSREHVTEEEEAAGYVLACRVNPTSDIRLAVVGSMKGTVCRTVEPTDGVPTHST